MKLREKGKYEDAIERFKEAVAKNPDFANAWYFLAGCHDHLGQKEEAGTAYESAARSYQKMLVKDDNPAVWLLLGYCYENLGQLDREAAAMDKAAQQYPAYPKLNYEAEARSRQRYALGSLKLRAEAPLSLEKPLDLGPGVNSPANDLFPQSSPDGRRLYFTSTRPGGFGGEDLYYVEQGADGWGAPVALPAPINSAGNDGAATFSGDGQTMILGICGRSEGFGSCDLYISTLEGSTWSEPMNLGSAVNSTSWESQPTLSADGRTLIFCSDRSGGLGQLDLWMTRRSGTDSWTAPVNLGSPVNTEARECAPYLSADGKTLYFSSGGHPGFGHLDVFKTVLSAAPPSAAVSSTEAGLSGTWQGIWTQPGYEYSAEMVLTTSTDMNVTGSISWTLRKSPRPNDQRIGRTGIEFVSGKFDPASRTYAFDGVGKDDPNNMVGLDTYRLDLAADGNGLSGKTKAGGKWDGKFQLTRSSSATAVGANAGSSGPVNLGRLINTDVDDNYFTIGGSGEIGYFASDRPGGVGGFDLYSVAIPEGLRPEATVIVQGVVRNMKNGSPMGALVVVENIKTGEPIGTQRSNSASGRYLVVLTAGQTYSISVSQDGYFFYSSRFDVPYGSRYNELTKDIGLWPIEKGVHAVMNNIFFETGKAVLNPESRLELARASALLKANPRIVVELGGHTDNVGGTDANMKLSHARAKAVHDALVASGISPNRLKAKGYGSSSPVADNSTEDGRQANRRTEMLVLAVDGAYGEGQAIPAAAAAPAGASTNGKTTAEFNPGKSYGTVTDIDGNVYKTITIGSQTWMAENLRTTRYRNGDAIPEVTDDAAWTAAKSGAYCNWENTRDVHSIATYGRIYNWYAATDSRNIAPTGWHVSSDEEWAALTRFLGGESIAGGKLREAGTTHWASNPYGTNESGFTALPGGVRGSGARFIDVRNNGTWFSSTEATSASAWYWAMYYGANEVYRGSGGKDGSGYYVRCVRD